MIRAVIVLIAAAFFCFGVFQVARREFLRDWLVSVHERASPKARARLRIIWLGIAPNSNFWTNKSLGAGIGSIIVGMLLLLLALVM